MNLYRNFYLLIFLCSVFRLNAQEQVDYKSKVPYFNFSGKLAEQEDDLADNPLILRFKESRDNYVNEKHRPIYHFVSPESRLNDPNGLCYWQGNWHLFYQAYPPEDPRQHWGHAVSKDLIHWRDLPYAIYPDPERAVFSGAIMVEDNRVIAMYHGTTQGNMVAISDDPLLLNWKKINEGKPVISVKSKDGSPLPYSVFDPTIWKKDKWYYSLSGSRAPKGPEKKAVRAHYLFRSKDLVNWEYLHEFIDDDRFTYIGDDGACPYFLPIGNRYIMPFFSHMTGGQYFIGDYNKKTDKFNVTAHGRFNFGATYPSGVHAPSAYPDGNGGIITILNMNQGRPTAATKGWNQLMTLPKRLTLDKNDNLQIEPIENIETLRYNHQKVENLKLPANQEIVIKDIKGNAMEIIAEIDAKRAPMVEMNVLRSDKKEEFTRISFFKERGFDDGRKYLNPPKNIVKNSVVSIETSYSSVLPDAMSRPAETAQVYIEKDEKLKLRVFIDKSVVEVFVNGKQCLAVRVYPGKEDSTGISFRSQGQDSQLISLNAWQMKSIY